MCHAAVVCSLMAMVTSEVGAVSPPPTPLAAAIAKFNAQAAADPIGKDQQPLTEDEVIAAILLSDKSAFPEASPELYERFRKIADTRELPADAQFESLNGIDPGGDFVYDVWHVRIMFPKEQGGTYSFTVRRSAVRARPVAEAAAELEDAITGHRPGPGSYRLEDRLKDLKARAAKAAQRRAER